MQRNRISVGLFISNINDPFDQAVYAGAAQRAKELDVNLFVFPGKYINPNYQDVVRSRFEYQHNTIFSYACKQNLDVLLILSGTIASAISLQDKKAFLKMFKEIPTILVADNVEGYKAVRIDNKSGLREGIEDLINNRGCRKIGMVSGPLTNNDAVERLDVYKETLRENGIKVSEKRIVYGNFSEYSETVVSNLLDDNPDLEAVVFANDQMALGGYDVFKKRGIVIGKDLYVMGFDDSPSAGQLMPGLTSVKSDVMELGRTSVEQACEYVQGLRTDFDPMKTKLIKRGSTGYSDGLSMRQITESDFYEKIEAEQYDLAALELLHISFDDRYRWYEKSSFISFLKSYISDFLNCMNNHERKIDYESAYFRLEQAVIGMENEEADKRIVFGMMNVLKNVLIEEKCDREKEMLDFQYSCMMQMMQVINNLGHKRDNETVFAQWISNSIAREMLTYGEGNDEAYASLSDKLLQLNFSASFFYTLEKPYVYYDDRVTHDWRVPSKVLLKSYYNNPLDVKVVPKEKQLMDSRAMFGNEFMDPNRRYTLIANLISVNEEQLGFLLCELPTSWVRHIYTITVQLSSTMKIMNMINEQAEIRKQLETSLDRIKENNKALEKISRLDELTGIYNRRGFMDTAVEQVQNKYNEGRTAILIFADLDNLKSINDKLGHDEGDFALRSIAAILKESLRQTDIISRIGGDEFMALALVSADDGKGEQIKARIVEVMDRFNEKCEKPYYIEASLGFAKFSCSADISLEEYMDLADEKLYEDKRRKRKNIMKRVVARKK